MPHDYLITVITPLLQYPDDLKIETIHDDRGILLTVGVNRGDMGAVIGKGGETAKAIRHLVRIVGMRNNATISVKISEPDGSDYKPNK